MLLVLNVVYHDKVPAKVARDLHRSRAWTCKWLKRYGKEGIDGLKDKKKWGRPPQLSGELTFKIKKILKENKQGWTTKQVNEIIVKEGHVK